MTKPEPISPAWDVFICHASEDKADVARPLANQLSLLGLRVWLDEAEIRLGDGLRNKIDLGLRHSRFGVVILSEYFFAKDWTRAELDGMIAGEVNEKKIVLPVWHNLTAEDVRSYSPILGGRLAIGTDRGLSIVAKKIEEAIAASGPRYVPGAPIFAGRLTKKVLFALPEGCFVMSNILKSDHTPQIAQQVPELSDREHFWIKLRTAGLATSKYYVFRDAGEFRRHVSVRNIWSPTD